MPEENQINQLFEKKVGLLLLLFFFRDVLRLGLESGNVRYVHDRQALEEKKILLFFFFVEIEIIIQVLEGEETITEDSLWVKRRRPACLHSGISQVNNLRWIIRHDTKLDMYIYTGRETCERERERKKLNDKPGKDENDCIHRNSYSVNSLCAFFLN